MPNEGWKGKIEEASCVRLRISNKAKVDAQCLIASHGQMRSANVGETNEAVRDEPSNIFRYVSSCLFVLLLRHCNDLA